MSVDDELLLGIARQLAVKPDGKQAGWQASRMASKFKPRNRFGLVVASGLSGEKRFEIEIVKFGWRRLRDATVGAVFLWRIGVLTPFYRLCAAGSS